MSNLVCSKRDGTMKIKKLRREGFVPGNIYGKNLEQSINIQIVGKSLSGRKSDLAIGSQMVLVVDGEEYNTMVKAVDFIPMSNSYQHFDFQVLTEGEKIKTSTPINFINKEEIQIEGNVQEYLNVVEYEVLPKDMIDSLEVDLSVLTLSNDIKVSDLAMANDDRFHMITPMNTVLVSLAPIQELVLETEETEDAEEVASEE